MVNGARRRRGLRPPRSAGVGEGADPELLKARLVDQYAHHYHLIVSIFKGVSLFAAAAAIHSIFSDGATLNVKLNALALWLGSFSTILVTYDAIMVTTIISVERPNVLDVVGPFLLGLGEFVQFTVLTLEGGDSASATAAGQLSQIAWWPLVFACSTAAGWANAFNYSRHLSGMVAHAPPQLVETYRRFHQNSRRDLFWTAVPPVFLLVAFAVLRWVSEDLRMWQGVLGVIVLCGNSGALLNYEMARRTLWDALRPHPAGEAGAEAQASAALPVVDPNV